MKTTKDQYIWGLLRIAMGCIMLWAFVDKTFGLGFATPADKAWLMGNSPTLGFLKSGTGPFSGFYQSIAGNPLVDLLFMKGLLLIGISLLLGIGTKIAGYSGALLMFLMWTASFPIKQNPLLDDHIIYLLIFLGFAFVKSGHWLGFGKWWSQTLLVKKYPFLE